MTSSKVLQKRLFGKALVSVMPGRTEEVAAGRIIGAVGFRVRFLESALPFLTEKHRNES